MVERDGGHADQVLVGLDKRRAPHFGLLHISQNIAMAEHGTLGHASGAAGVLQESQVVRLDIGFAKPHLRASLQHVPKGRRPRQVVSRNGIFDLVNHKVRHMALMPRHHVCQTADYHVLYLGLVDDFGQGVGKQIYRDDGQGTRITQLVFQLAPGVHGVDVDHHIACAQQAEQAYRILQHIGHHQRHPAARRQMQDRLEIGRDLQRQRI